MLKKKFDNNKIGLTAKELSVLKKLDTPQKIQDFISAIPQNFEPNGDSCMSVREVLKNRRAHCIEGALVAALALWVHGEAPLILDMTASSEDFDHVIASIKSKRVPIAKIITHRTSFAHIANDLPIWSKDKTGLIKALVDIS